MKPLTMVEAINQALAHEMARDDSVVILGEDTGVAGGVFRATVDLRKEFGYRRVMDTPLAEALIAGLSVGMAAHGLRPVAEIQFMGFIYAAIEQIVSHAARMRNRTRGRLSCPLVIRSPFGAGIHAPELHSESTEAIFAHIPGLRVVIPSSPARAYGLLTAAIRDNDPVIFLEPARLYRAVKHDISQHLEPLPLDTCFTLRAGEDISIVTWGAEVMECLAAAAALAAEGVYAEVIDVATVKPLDIATILTSVKKTGRLLIVHEAARTGGIGAEIAAQVAERGFGDLRTPPRRLTGYDTVPPYYRLEKYYMPDEKDIIRVAREMIAS